MCAVLAGCADLPDLDETVPPAIEEADYPELVPVEQILGRSATEAERDRDTADGLDARVAGLQARAGSLQSRPALDADTRNRLDAGVDTALPADD